MIEKYNTEQYNTFVSNYKYLIKKKNIQEKDIAIDLHISKSTLSGYIHDIKRISDNIIRDISLYLGYPPETMVNQKLELASGFDILDNQTVNINKIANLIKIENTRINDELLKLKNDFYNEYKTIDSIDKLDILLNKYNTLWSKTHDKSILLVLLVTILQYNENINNEIGSSINRDKDITLATILNTEMKNKVNVASNKKKEDLSKEIAKHYNEVISFSFDQLKDSEYKELSYVLELYFLMRNLILNNHSSDENFTITLDNISKLANHGDTIFTDIFNKFLKK